MISENILTKSDCTFVVNLQSYFLQGQMMTKAVNMVISPLNYGVVDADIMILKMMVGFAFFSFAEFIVSQVQ